MRAVPAILICAGLLTACGSQAETAAPGLADLVVRVDDDGARGPDGARQLTLRCSAPGDSPACGAVARMTTAQLAPTPADRACTQIYGGPQTASIAGRLRGAGVDARFSRVDGCQIARWQAVQPLLREVH